MLLSRESFGISEPSGNPKALLIVLFSATAFLMTGTVSADAFTQSGWNQGTFNATSSDKGGNSGNLGMGHPNGTGFDSLEVYYRFDKSPQKVVLGEAGTFNTSNGNWVNVSFQNSYTDPVVVGTSNTHTGDPALVFESKNVSSTWAYMRVCESDGGTNDGCDNHPEERVGYMVVDVDDADTLAGVDAGTFSQDAEIDTDTTTLTYNESFSSTPYVFTSVQTTEGATPIESRVTSYSQSDFTAGICHTDGTDSCDPGHVAEEVGWVALEPGNLPFNQDGELGVLTGIGNSDWTSDTFSSPFSTVPVVLAENPTESGSQELQIDEARSVTTTGLEVRYCEIQPEDTCDGHTGEDVAWLAVDEGELSKAKLKDYSGNGREASKLGPQVSDTGVMSTDSYAFDGKDDFIFLEPFTYFEEQVSARSYSLWFKANETSEAQFLFEEGGDVNGLNMYINDSKLYYGAYSESKSYFGDWISTTINSDQWYHATFRFTDTNMSAYLDGQYVGSVDPGTSIETHGGDSSIGSMKANSKTASGNQTGDGYYFNGSIDEFRSFSKEISDNKIQQEYFWGKDSVFDGDYSSDIFDRLEKKNWERVTVNATLPASAELSMDFEALTGSGEVADSRTFTVSGGVNDYLLDGLEYTQKYRVNFSGNTTSLKESWTVDSYEVISDDVPPEPTAELLDPLNDSTPRNNVSFKFKPKCYSDLGCDSAELFFNFTENFTENRVTDTEEEFDRGSFTNTSSSQGSVKLNGIEVASGNFQSSTGQVNVNDVGFQPDVIEFTVTNTNPSFDTTTERGGEPYGFGHGFADCKGSNCDQVAFTQASGSASTNGAFAASSDRYAILMGDTANDGTGGSIGIKGNVTSTSTNGFTVTFDKDTVGNQVTYRAYKLRGDVDVGYFNTPTSAGQQSYSTGFQPDYLNIITQPQLTSMNSQNTFAGSDNGWSHGYATDTGSSEQVAMGVSQYQNNIDDHVFTSSSGQVIDLLEAKSKGGITDRMDASLASFDPNGFTLDYSSTASGQPAIYLAMDTGGNAEAGYKTTPTSTGDQQVNTGISPEHINFVASNTISGIGVEGHSGANGAENHWGWMFGSGNTTSQQAMGFSSHSNSVNGHASGSSATELFQLLYSNQGGTILGQDSATLSSTSTNSFTLNWNSITTTSTTDVKYNQVLYSYVAFNEDFKDEGTYESDVFKAQKPVYWNNSDTTVSKPAGTSIDLEYGENTSGSFQYYSSITQLPRSKHFRYRANLSTTDPEKTPVLEKVNITYLRPESWNARKTVNTVTNNTEKTVEFNFSSLMKLPNQVHWNFRVNQTDGRAAFGPENYTARIAKNSPEAPLWRNQSQEKSTVPQSGTNNLRAEGFDSVRLSHAILATNESGVWQNKTGKYGSPKMLMKDARWKWTNFTWVNSSLVDENVGWRIWYNDTNGRYNSTPVESFYVTSVDSAPPVITIHSPRNTSYSYQDVDLDVTASETVDQWKYNLSNGNQSFNPNKTLSSVSEGHHFLRVWANDTSDNWGNETRSFTVDVTPPTVTNLQDNVSGEFFQSDTANISVDLSDSISGVRKIKLATDETGSFRNKTAYGSPETYSNISEEMITEDFIWENRSFSGTLNYKVWVRDAAGNWESSSSSSFQVNPLETYLFANITGGDWNKGKNDDMAVRDTRIGIGTEDDRPNLEELWMFEENDATEIKDRTSGIEAAPSGGITTGKDGILNSGTYSFDGTDDYIAVNRSYDTSKDIKHVTVCAWAKSSTDKGQIIMSYDRSEFWRFSLSSAQGANGFVGWQTEGADMNGNTRVTDGNWHHICAVFDSSVAKEKKIYVDGQLDAESDQFSTGTGFGTADGSEDETYGFIGTGSEAANFDGATGPGQYLEGKIDSLHVFNRSLSQNEIKELAVSDPPRKGSHLRKFDVPGYQEPRSLEPDSSGINADTELKVKGSNPGGKEAFIDTSNGRENFSLTLDEDDSLDLILNASTDLATESPEVKSLSIWTEAKMYTQRVSVINENGNKRDESSIELFNRFGDFLKRGTLSALNEVSDRIPRQENFSISMRTSLPYSFTKVRLNQIKSDDGNLIEFQSISNYSGTSLPSINLKEYEADPVLALNDDQLTYSKAEIQIPYTNETVDKIAHCKDWDFNSGECRSVSDWELNDPSFYSASLNGTHAIFNVTGFDAYATAEGTQTASNFQVTNVTVNNTRPVSGNDIMVKSNISNNESKEDTTPVKLKVETYNGTEWELEYNVTKSVHVGANSYNLTNFTWVSQPGRFRFNVTADPNDIDVETDETDNSNTTGINVSSHQIFYGGNDVKVKLSNLDGDRLYANGPGYENSTLMFTDQDVSFSATDLEPLNGSSDLSQADKALNLSGHNDSLSNLYDPNDDGDADSTRCMYVGNRDLCQVPVINSTVTDSFLTGVVYDSDSGMPYDGSQELIFMTETNDSKTGDFGTYDYEIRVPFTLENQKPNTDEITIYSELN